MATLNDRPFFTVRIDINGCRFDVRVNDVPILENDRGHPVTVEMPVNHYLVSGANQLSFALRPTGGGKTFDADAQASVTLNVRQKGTPRESNVEVSSIVFAMAEVSSAQDKGVSKSRPSGKFDSRQEFRASPNGDVISEDVAVTSLPLTGEIKASRMIQLHLPLPAWIWLDSQAIEETPAAVAELWAEYKKFWELLSGRRVEEAIKLCEAKSRELAAAFYLTSEEARDYLQIDGLINDGDVELFRLNSEGIRMQTFGNRRLARILSRRGQSPIVFVEKDRSAGHYLELIYCRTNKGWIMIR